MTQPRALKPGKLLTSTQAAYVLGIDKSTLLSWVELGKITPAEVTPGGHRRYAPEDVHRLLPRARLAALRANADSAT